MTSFKDRWQSLKVPAYVGAVATLAASLAILLATLGYTLGNVWVTLGLAGIAGFSERGRVKLGSNVEESISLLPTLFAALLFGPLAAMVVFAASMLGDLKRPYLPKLLYASSRAITGGLTGIAAQGVERVGTSSFGSVVVAAALAATLAQSVDVAFASLTFKLRGHGGMLKAARSYAPAVVTSVPLYAGVVAILVLAYEEISNWTLPLFFVPALAAQRVFVLYQDQRKLAEDLSLANTRLERANMSFAAALVATLDARDRYTAGHSAAVAIYSRDIAQRMGLRPEQQQLAHLCGLVHDIGKIGLHPGLLEKPGSLTLAERRQMEEHSAIGERILAKVDDYSEIAAIVRHHHERMDGEGYPDKLASESIPLLSRIVAVADAYNAMTSDRPYRDAMPSRVARLRLAQAVETQFDTSVVAAFEAILATAGENYRTGSRADFKLETQDEYAESGPLAQIEVAQSA